MSSGVEGRRWLDELPGVVASLSACWGLQLGRSFHGGTASFVVAATDRRGSACVLKVATSFDDDDLFRRSVLAHRIAGGRGCARLLDHDESVPAMLLERLGANLDDQGMAVPRMLETIATTLRPFW